MGMKGKKRPPGSDSDDFVGAITLGWAVGIFILLCLVIYSYIV